MSYFYRAVGIVFLLSGLALSQIQITRQDIPQTPGKQFNFMAAEDKGFEYSIPIDIGNEGGGNSWDFSTIEVDTIIHDVYYEQIDVVDYSQTAYRDSFPQANLCYKISNPLYPEIYIYFILSDQFLNSIGWASTYFGQEIIGKNQEYFGNLPLPLSYQMATSYTYSDTIVLQGGTIINVVEVTDSVDAYGTIQIPSGTYQALRVFSKERDIEIQNFGIETRDTTYYYTYTWLTKDNFFVATADVEPPLNKTGGIVNASYIEIQQSDVVSINDEGNSLQKFHLSQNYPNPFNPVTTIPFELSKSGYMEIKLYNAAGQKIKTIASGMYNAGSHKITFSANELPSGTYYYQLKTREGKQVRKMILLK